MINAPLPPAPLRRTRSGTWDTPDPALCPGRVVPSGFPSPRPLPSTTSAAIALFGGFVGTTRRSDFPPSYIPGVRPQPSLSGPTPISGTGEAWDLPVLAHRVSTFTESTGVAFR